MKTRNNKREQTDGNRDRLIVSIFLLFKKTKKNLGNWYKQRKRWIRIFPKVERCFLWWQWTELRRERGVEKEGRWSFLFHLVTAGRRFLIFLIGKVVLLPPPSLEEEEERWGLLPDRTDSKRILLFIYFYLAALSLSFFLFFSRTRPYPTSHSPVGLSDLA